MISTFRAFSRVLAQSRRWVLVGVGFGVLQSAFLAPIGLLVRHAFDEQIPDDDVGGLVVSGGLILVLALASTAIALLGRHLVLGSTKDAIRSLRVALAERVNHLPVSWFDEVEDGVVHSTIVQDTERLDAATSALAAQFMPAAIVSLSITAALAVLAPTLTLVLYVGLPLIVLAWRIPAVALRRRTAAYQEAFDRFSVRVRFLIGAATLIRTDGAEDRETRRSAAAAAQVATTGRRLAWLQFAASQLTGFLATTTGIAVLIIGGAQVARDNMTFGTLLGFYALVNVLRGQLGTVLSSVPVLIVGIQALARLDAILGADAPAAYSGRGTIAFRGGVTLDRVGFAFRPGTPVLSGVSMELGPGEIVGLVGPNGAGKSTIAALMLGLRRPQAGTVSVDGVPLDQLDVADLRRSMAIVPQLPLLFPGTVAENIVFAAETAGTEDVRAASALATADEVVAHLSGGYDAAVGDDGKLLSGGEQQRLAVARALLRRPALLILDEPTNHLDAGSGRDLLASLRALPWRPTVLIISHDEHVLEAADRIYVLEAGRVSERAAAAAEGRTGG